MPLLAAYSSGRAADDAGADEAAHQLAGESFSENPMRLELCGLCNPVYLLALRCTSTSQCAGGYAFVA